MKYIVDIDGILCYPERAEFVKRAKPKEENINKINNLKNAGNKIVIFTSRPNVASTDTIAWLKEHGVMYDEIIFDKPVGDFYIDDFAINSLPYVRPLKKKKKLVLCISGGLDSVIAYYIAKERGYEPICLFFNIGQPYYKKEKRVLENIGIKFKEINLSDIYVDVKLNDHILPNRNSIFANIASLYGNLIWICGLKHEDHYLMFDKNTQFYQYLSLSLSQSNGENILVETPYKNWSKTDILKYCKKNNLISIAEKTTSCYHPEKIRCGECSLCIRRFIAEKTAGINIPFAVYPPTTTEYKQLMKSYKKALKEQDFSHYSKDRIKESLLIDSNL